MASSDIPIAADDPQARDEALQLIGRFFVNFSRYITHLELGLSWCIGGFGDPRINRTMWAVTNGMEANRLREAFFAATILVREPTEQEHKIRKELNKRAQELGKRRNDLAHGAWYLFSSSEGEAVYKPTLLRKSVKLNEEPGHRRVVESHEELAALAQEAEDVADLVWQYIDGLLLYHPGLPGVTDRLGFDNDGKLVRQDLTGWAWAPEA